MKKIIKKSLLLFLVFSLFATGLLGNLATAFAHNNNAKVELAVCEIENDKLVGINQSSREFWADEGINAAVDLDISGDGVKYENPVVRIKVKKSDIITKPDFAASQNSVSSKLIEDKEYFIFEHVFKVLTGGQHLTFPLPYKFDPEKNIKNGDTSSVIAEFFTRSADGTETPIKTSQKTYVARVAEIKTHLYMYNYSSYKFKYEDENGNEIDKFTETPIHYARIHVNQNDADKTRMSPGTSLRYQVRPYQYIDLPKGVTGRMGYLIPKNVTFVIKFPEKIIKASRWPVENGDTIIAKSGKMAWTDSYDNKPAWFYGFWFDIENAKLKEKIRFDVDYYINYGEPDQRQIQPSRHGYIYIEPIPFSVQGSFAIRNSGYAHVDNPKQYYPNMPYSTWSRISNHYSYMNGSLFYRDNNADEIGMVQRYHFVNWNNGGSAGQTIKTGGVISNMQELTVELQGHGEYFKAFNLSTLNQESLKKQVDSTGNTVYGIKKDGSKVQLAKNVKTMERIDIQDITRQYDKLNIVFDTPIKLDNQTLVLVTYTHLEKDELDKFKSGEYKETRFYKTHATAQVQSAKEPITEQKYTTAHSNDDWGDHKVSPVRPVVNEFPENNNFITYQKGGTPFEHRVGPYVDGNNDSANWGDIKKVGHVKTITLLPTGIVYQKNHPNKDAKVIENYKNTGKTAVIIDYKDLEIKDGNYKSEICNLFLKATKNTRRGENIIETYMIYDTNDIVKPYSKDITVADTLDLDDDGDTMEEFMLKKRIITYIPALELILHKDIRDLDGHTDTTTSNLDLNDKADYVVSLFNNSLVPVRKVSLIDKLPFVGDTTIVPNDDGKYEERGSKFSVCLRDFVENIAENNAILADFDVYYSMDKANTMEGIRDSKWLAKSAVADISKVQNLKFVLKNGKTIEPKAEAKFIIPGIMPSDKSLDKSTASSVNTSAFSTDDIGYNEGNNARAGFVTYSVDGKIYEDKNANGIFDAGDVALNNVTVQLLDSKGNIAKCIDNQILQVKTNAEGKYHFDVYARGKYTVNVINPQKYFEFNTSKKSVEEIASNAGSSIGDTARAKSGKSAEFTLDPQTPVSIQNAALLRNSFRIDVSKIWKTPGSAKQKAYFALEAKYGEQWKPIDLTTMDFANKIYAISKNAQGEYKSTLEVSTIFKNMELRVVETDQNGVRAQKSAGKTHIKLNDSSYFVTVKGNKTDGFVITNVLQVKNAPQTGDNSHTFGIVLIAILSAFIAFNVIGKAKRKHN